MGCHPVVCFGELLYYKNMDASENAIGGIDMKTLRPVLPQRLDWSSIIGVFILNFGKLELALSDILMSRTKLESRNGVLKKTFHEKIRCLEKLAGQHPSMEQKREKWEALIARMDAIRDLRNHLAHGTLVHTIAEDLKSVSQSFCLIHDVCACVQEAVKVTFEELYLQNQLLADVVGELAALDSECGGAHKPSE